MSSLLPTNLQDESNLALEECIKQELNIDMKPFMTSILNYVPNSVLPYIAKQYHVTGDEGWNDCTTREEKLDLLSNAVDIHRKKGTVGAVKKAINIDGYSATYRHWKEYGGIPHHFKIAIDLNNLGISEELQNSIKKKIEECKQLRAKLDALNIYVSETNNINVKTAVCLGEMITVDFR